MLLVLRKQQQATKVVPRPLPGVTVTGTLNEEVNYCLLLRIQHKVYLCVFGIQKGVGTLTRNRSLPKWVSETLPPMVKNCRNQTKCVHI